MSIDNVNVVDGLAADQRNGVLYLLLTDHLEWVQSENALSERDHLLLLQEKINAYISFIEEEQFKSKYPNLELQLAIIEIHFQYDITENCERFLQAVQSQVKKYRIKIETHIG